MLGYYDVQQVCENGHKITSTYKKNPQFGKNFCDKCGSKTISKCLNCNVDIRGLYYAPGIISLNHTIVPSYCHNCGKPYPWTESKIVAAIQVFAEFDTENEVNIEQDIKNIARDIPQAKPSAIRIKRLCEKYGAVAYNVVMEFASKTAAEILKG